MKDSIRMEAPLLESLCAEAVAHCGADMPAIEKFVADRLASLSGEERDRLLAQVSMLLAFAAEGQVWH